MNDTAMIDVIITSTARETIFPTIESFLDKVKFSGTFRFLINVDCCYNCNVRDIYSLFDKLNVSYFKVNFQRFGFTRAASSLIKLVETPYYFHLEDDWVFLQEIYLDDLLTLFNNHRSINHIRFSKEQILPFDELYYLRKIKSIPIGYDGFKTRNVVIGDTGLVETMNYSANPNLSRTNHFKRLPYTNSLDLEQQFCLQSFIKKLMFRMSSGYFILGQIGDAPAVKHIG
jgi:hypothetical protein